MAIRLVRLEAIGSRARQTNVAARWSASLSRSAPPRPSEPPLVYQI